MQQPRDEESDVEANMAGRGEYTDETECLVYTKQNRF